MTKRSRLAGAVLLLLASALQAQVFTNATKLRGRAICVSTPSDTNVLVWSASKGCWDAAAAGGLAAIADQRILGNVSGGSAVPIGITAAQVATFLGLATVATSGSASDLGSGTLNHARLPSLVAGDIPAALSSTTSVNGTTIPASDTLLTVSGNLAGIADPAAARANLGLQIGALLPWTLHPPAENNSWSSLVWAPALNLFVAVSPDGTHRVMTSPDGVTWTAQTAAEANTWNAVAWSADLGLLVAVASNGTHRVMTSPDGVTWTAQTAAEANTWSAVAWSPSLGLFAAGSGNGTHHIMTSPDGITWTARTCSATIVNLIWGGASFVAANGLFTSSITTSTDGVTWTSRTVPMSNWMAAAWSPALSLFVVVSNLNLVITSPDGVTWTSRTPPDTALADWMSVAWSPELGLFVACATSGVRTVMTSPDGITWTGHAGYGIANALAWSPSKRIFAVVGIQSNFTATSPYPAM